MNEFFVFRELNRIAARSLLPIPFQILIATVNESTDSTHSRNKIDPVS